MTAKQTLAAKNDPPVGRNNAQLPTTAVYPNTQPYPPNNQLRQSTTGQSKATSSYQQGQFGALNIEIQVTT